MMNRIAWSVGLVEQQFEPAPFLDGKYTVWGQVTAGMEAIDAIKRGQGQSGMVTNPDQIVRMQVAADAEKAG